MVTQITMIMVCFDHCIFLSIASMEFLIAGYYAGASTSDPTDNRPEPLAEDKMKVDNSVIINRTRLQPCDRVTTLYTLDPPTSGDKSIYDEPANDCERFNLKSCKLEKHNFIQFLMILDHLLWFQFRVAI